MVRAEDLVVNGRGLYGILQPVRDQKIVDAPARVLLPRMEAVAPPRIRAGEVRVSVAEGVGKARVQ